MYLENLRLDGELTVITGAGGGRLGTETAVALSEVGARVVGIDVSLQQLDESARRIASFGGSFLGVEADVMQPDAVRDVIDRISREQGAIQHYVHVVGGSRPDDWRTLDSYTNDQFDRVLAFNLRPVFQYCREVGRRMIADGTRGTIVNFSSMSGATSAPFHGAYGAAKAAVAAMTKTMAVEWGAHGIRVNAVAPGQTQIGSAKKRPPRTIRQDPRWNPLERGIEFSEVAGAVLFLTSKLSSGITGQTINIDAGASARSPMGGMDYWEQFGGVAPRSSEATDEGGERRN